MLKLKKIADNADPDSLASHMRRKRTARFLDMLEDFPEPVRILDVGGTLQYWRPFEFERECRIILLNLEAENCGDHPFISSIAGDARAMSIFGDHEFDICFSNSVIEHVGTLFDQIAMGREIHRVAKAYFVQTPNRYFPLEPHFLVPFWQFLPVAGRAFLLSRLNLGWMKKAPDALTARAEVEQIRLLTDAEMKGIFPKGNLHREKLGPFTKSLIITKSASQP